MFYVYTLTNRVNGRIYVGQSFNPSYRLKKHLWALGSGKHQNKELQADFNKYGNCFDLKVVLGPFSRKEALAEERRLMEELGTYREEIGYNCNDQAMIKQREAAGLTHRESPVKGKHIIQPVRRNERAGRKMYKAVEKLAKERGISIYKMCKLAGVTPSCLYLAKSRGNMLQLSTVAKLADVLGTSAEKLYEMARADAEPKNMEVR